MNDIYIFDINWKRAILEVKYTLTAPEAKAAEGEQVVQAAQADSTAVLGTEAVQPGCPVRQNADQLEFYRVDEQRFIPFTIVNAGEYMLARLNIMTAKGREPLTKGRWIICRRIREELLGSLDVLLNEKPYLEERIRGDVRRKHKEVQEKEDALEDLFREEGLSYVVEHPYDTHGISYAPEILCDTDKYSRFFCYANRTFAYAAWFSVRETAEQTLVTDLNIDYYMRNPDPHLRRHSKRYKEKQIFNLIYRMFSVFARRKGNRVLFYKQNGEHPTDNMEALITRMRERSLEKDFSIACRCRDIFSKKQRVIPWLRDLWEIAKSDYIFIDDYTPVFSFIDLADDVVLTQLWHAGVGFKSVGYARFGQTGSPDPFSSSHRHYTYALVGNEHLRDIYAEVFGIEKEALLATGMPRLDHFLDEGTAEKARKDLYGRYPVLKTGRVILFAPTFRGTGQKSAYFPYSLLDIEALYKMCTETDSYFIFEMHHFIKKRPEIAPEYADRVWDLTDENLNELFHIADVLITDYSSCFYDFLLLKKPVILYVPDKMKYTAVRGVQRPIDEMAPGEVCETFEALVETLKTGHYKTVLPKALTIDRAAEKSGLASDRVIDTILKKKDVPGVKMGC